MPSVRADSGASSFITPLIIGCGLLMQGLEGTAIATALPAMAQGFGESPIRLNLAISAYLLCVAVFIPVSGWIADRFGARNVFCVAMGLFVVSSMMCGLSATLLQLVAARSLQGVAGALMMPVGRLVLLRTTPRAQIVRAMSVLTVPAVLGPIIGPPLGGLIVQAASWRWIFLLSAPVGLIGVVASLVFIPDVRGAAVRALDAPGFLLAGAGVAGLVLAMGEIGVPGRAPVVFALLAAGMLCLLLYSRHQSRAAHPILDLGLTKIPTFGIAVTFGSLWRIAMAASPLLLVMLLQVGFGLSPLQSGLISFAGAAGALLMKGAALPILRRFGFRRVLLFNSALSGVLFMAQGFLQQTTPHWVIFVLLLVSGFFRSLQYTSLGSLCYADVPERALSGASTIASMTQELSQSFGAALAAVVLQSALALRGGTSLAAADVSGAFLFVGALSLAPLIGFARLPRDAGDAINGRAGGRLAAAEPAE
jgi:EmrB/QacA subfamily drug resistance transporter